MNAVGSLAGCSQRYCNFFSRCKENALCPSSFFIFCCWCTQLNQISYNSRGLSLFMQCFKFSPFRNKNKSICYCHVSGVPWLITTGSGLDDWIYLRLLLQSLLITINYNQWLSKTRSTPYWTTSVFSSIVTGLVLICESVTSSASVVLWLTLHSWTLNTTELLNVTELSHERTRSYVSPLYNFGEDRI
jgi:hypothetical protein